MTGIEEREMVRLQLQRKLDAAKSSAERNRLGQFATPSKLADEIVLAATSLLPSRSEIRFLDPAFGTGSFYSALLRSTLKSRIETATGYEIDPHYGERALELWSETGLQLHLTDFTKVAPPENETTKFNLVVCNPPYVRHHHLSQSQKRRLQTMLARYSDIEMNGLSGLYCYFMVLSQAWMAKNGTAAWLIPSEFMGVNYGVKIKRFLQEKVTLLRIHRFDPNEVQFEDALVSSAVVFFRNSPPENQGVEFTFGGTVTIPRVAATMPMAQLRHVSKWTSLPQRAFTPAGLSDMGTLADLFTIKRGLATGCNEFFILSPAQVREFGVPHEFLKPILPSSKNLEGDEVRADPNGDPKIANPRFLLDCSLPEDLVREKYPLLWTYFCRGKDAGVNQRYICQHREPWYAQESRPPAPFLCTYMGRPTRKSDCPFRFILNHSNATAANVYLLLYPKSALAAVLNAEPELKRTVWKALSSITSEVLTGEGRIYGGGLFKMEPKELANVAADLVLNAIPLEHWPVKQKGLF
jgi:adenine-specific DNA-methyltransferase